MVSSGAGGDLGRGSRSPAEVCVDDSLLDGVVTPTNCSENFARKMTEEHAEDERDDSKESVWNPCTGLGHLLRECRRLGDDSMHLIDRGLQHGQRDGVLHDLVLQDHVLRDGVLHDLDELLQSIATDCRAVDLTESLKGQRCK